MPGTNLTHVEAQRRAEVVRVDSYDVHLDLREGAKTFRSVSEVRFSASAGEETFIDLIAPTLIEATLNGEKLPVDSYDGARLPLPNLAEHNTLRVVAECAYMHTGEGMHRFTDPADGLDYVYTQFEVPDARRVFAVFEQPDLKAEFTFTVDAPEGWVVLSNSQSPTSVALDDGGQRFAFETHPRISSYITAIVAGPYVGVTDELTSIDGRTIPLSVWGRKSLEKEVRADAEEILTITKQGFAFYEAQFDRPYPFATYDQIFVPEYNAGAMENAGCVTFRDEYIFRSTPTRAQRLTRGNTILHELAHMWFGDLVTMKWWNDLWLNESFAEFMAYLSEAEATEFEDAWTAFNIRKEWGVRCDQLPTTHPIKADIRDLADVEVNFDGITYSKGAAVLRQLVSYVGRENFMRALNAYFAAHEWDNATLDDLLGQLEKTSGRDLREWSKVWLEEAGITLLRADVKEADDGSMTSLDIVQELPMEGTSHRPHRVAVGGYDWVGEELQRIWRIETDVEGEVTRVAEAQGKRRAPLILVNDDDLTYAKVRLDADSLKVAGEHIDAIADPLARALVNSLLWSMCRDGELATPAYLDAALRLLAVETNADVIRGTIANVVSATHNYTSPAVVAQAHADVASRLLGLLESGVANADAHKLILQAFTSVAVDPHRELLEGWLVGRDVPGEVELDQETRWMVVRALAALGAPESIIESEEARDDTLTGRQQAAGARAGRPGSVREEAFASIMSDQSIPNATLVEMVRGFASSLWRDPAANERVVEEYIGSASRVWDTYTHHMASTLISGMYPLGLAGRTSTDLVAATRGWLEDNAQAPRALRRLMRENLADAERAVKAQQCEARAW